MKYYPPLSQLIAREALPSDIGFFGPANEAIEDVLDDLLSGIRFKDLVINQSAFGDVRFYSLTIVAKEFALRVPGTGLSFLFFPGADGSGEANIPVAFEWRWGIKRYVNDFEAALFSHSPRALFDLLLKIANISEAQFIDGIIRVFIGDPEPYTKLVQDIKALISDYKDGITMLEDPSGEILAKADAIIPSLDSLIADLQDPTQMAVPFETAIDHIADSLENIATTLDIDLDVCRLAFNTVTRHIQAPDELLDSLLALFGSWFGGFNWQDLEELLIPQMSVALDTLKVGIRFPSTVLRQVDAAGKPLKDPLNQDVPGRLTFDVATVKYSTARGFEFDLADSLNIDFPRAEILKSGFILELHDLKVDFSRTTNIPEAIADGRPTDFVGVYVKDGTISFPAFWKHDVDKSTGVIKARNLLVGTGGVSGTLSLEAKDADDPGPLIECQLGEGFSVSLDKFSLTFKQNAIQKGTLIEGTLIIPGFQDANKNPAKIRIKVDIQPDGDFNITASEDDGFQPIHCGDVFKLILKSVGFGKEDDDFFLEVSGTIVFKHDKLADVEPIEVEQLRIWSNGRFEIKGGTIPLPKNISFPIGPAELSISAIHMGSHQRIDPATGVIEDFRYFGFDGGVDVNPGGLDVRGKGIKFFYPADLVDVLNRSYLEIKSIEIDLVIPGTATKETATLLISGFLSIGGTDIDPAWEGGVSFALPKMQIAGGASMQLRPKVPAFIVDAFVELSTPIPLGATSLGIYGFRGLFGQRYVPTKAKAGLGETATWFDYYKALKPEEGVHTSKFEGPSETKSYESVFSVGAGVSLASAKDSGETISFKFFLLLSLPELIYLEGKANILGPRVGLTGEDPAFFAVLAFSPQSVEMGIGVNYKLPRDGDQKGWILDLNAEMRAAFFFKNSSAWYINFGTIQNPTTARVLSLFDATAYVMLSAAGIAAGASVTFAFSKSYAAGLVHVSAGVYIKVGAVISFQSPQMGGSAMLGGHIDVRLFWFSFYLSIDTSLSVEVARPFYVQGSVELCVGVTIGFWKFKKTIHKCFRVEFKWEKNREIQAAPIPPFADLTQANALSPVMGTNMLSGETFKIVHLDPLPPPGTDPIFDQALLPLDTWVDFEFLKGLVPSLEVDERIGRLTGQAPANATDLVPPAGVPHQVTHAYSIKKVEIKAWNGSAWVDYRPYEAMSPPDALTELEANPSAYKDGFWQNSGSGFNKLRLLSETSLSYMQQGQPGWYVPEQFGITSTALFCVTRLREKKCIGWTDVAPGTRYADGAWGQKNTMLFRVSGGPGTVINWTSPFDIPRSLVFPNESTAQIVFNKPCAEVNLKLTTFSSGVVIRFFKRTTVDARFAYALVETRQLSQLQLLAEVRYHDPAVPVAKVEIDPINADPAVITALRIQLDTVNRQLSESTLAGIESAALLGRIDGLEQQLASLNDQGCRPGGIDGGTLDGEILILDRKVKECTRQLAALVTVQARVCQEAADLRDRFTKCFPSAPSTFSHEIFTERDEACLTQFRFRVFDDVTNVVLFTGTRPYPDAASAESALTATLKLAPYVGNYALMAGAHGKYFFQLVDLSGQFIAASPALFDSWHQLFTFVEQTSAAFRAAQTGGVFSPPGRVAGRLPCDESLVHLACWGELPVMGAVSAGRCSTIVAGILSARDAFCDEYNKLYRELYACNKKLLDDVTRRCEELTIRLEIKRRECATLAEQLAALIQLQTFIGTHGPLLPPEGAPCSTLLHEACCLSLEDYEFNISAPGQDAIDQDYGDAVDAIKKWLTPIWRPDTEYYVRLQVTDTVTAMGVTASPRPFDFYFGFRTAGPIGYFHLDPDANYVKADKKPDQYMLTGLKGYIDYNRSYPNADGELIRAKPLLYEDARILLFFTKRYAYHFFGDWPAYKGLPARTGSMQIVIKDPAGPSAIPNSPPPPLTEIPQAVVTWEKDEPLAPRLSEDIRTLLTLRNPELLNPDFEGDDCWESGGEMITPASVYVSVTPQFLKPLKLYTAVVNNVYEAQRRVVHEYVFQTSRYPNFPAQVNSYRLDDGKGNQREAVYPVDVALLPADIALMFDVVAGQMSSQNAELAGTWADPFDRLVEGVMKLKPLDAAVTTEFNIVRNSTTNAVIAVWIRNPESFNNPRLDDGFMKQSLAVMDGPNLDPSYKVLFSKDCSQMFVMHPSRVIPVTQMKFRFAYIEWDGDEYVERHVVVSSLIPMNI